MKILDLLANRHSTDVFVPECKDGPTHYGSHLRLDAWAMPRSWSKPWTVGYEIKVSRGDFMRDDKWPAYLDLCHQLYFVCPHGLIQPEELPDQVGLLWMSKTETRLYAKRKAPIRTEVEIPESLWRYVLMCRSEIKTERHAERNTVDDWKAWLREREEKRNLGYMIRGTIATLYAEMESRLRLAESRANSYDRIEQRLSELGLDPKAPVSEWELDRTLDNAIKRASPELVRRLTATARDLEALCAELDVQIGERGRSAQGRVG